MCTTLIVRCTLAHLCRASTAQLLARMAKQQLLVDDSCIEEEREIEQRNTVVVPEY